MKKCLKRGALTLEKKMAKELPALIRSIKNTRESLERLTNNLEEKLKDVVVENSISKEHIEDINTLVILSKMEKDKLTTLNTSLFFDLTPYDKKCMEEIKRSYETDTKYDKKLEVIDRVIEKVKASLMKHIY